MTLEYGTPQYGTPEYGTHCNAIDTWTEATTNWTIPFGGTVATSTNRVVGDYSVTFRTLNPARRWITLTLPTPIDTTGTDRLAFWYEIFAKNGTWNGIECHSDNTNSNYFILPNPTILYPTDWSLNEFLKSSFMSIGMPNWANIEIIKFDVTASTPPIFTWGIDGLGFYNGTPTLGTINYGIPSFDPSP